MDEVVIGDKPAAATPGPPKKRSHHAKLQRWGNANARKHGLETLRTAMKALGRRAIDGRTRVGKALNLWRKELVDDMGGDENVSVQQKTIIDLIVKQKLILDSIDAWLLERPLIDRANKSLVPIVRERQT
jgi:hypothetical protein